MPSKKYNQKRAEIDAISWDGKTNSVGDVQDFVTSRNPALTATYSPGGTAPAPAVPHIAVTTTSGGTVYMLATDYLIFGTGDGNFYVWTAAEFEPRFEESAGNSMNAANTNVLHAKDPK